MPSLTFESDSPQEMRRWIGIRTDGQLRDLMAQAASVRNVGHSVVTFSPKVPTHSLGKI